jgi:hypothetical protein
MKENVGKVHKGMATMNLLKTSNINFNYARTKLKSWHKDQLASLAPINNLLKQAKHQRITFSVKKTETEFHTLEDHNCGKPQH